MLDLDSRPTGRSTAITVTAAALLGLGVVMVFSATASLTAQSVTDNPLQNAAVRQAGFSICALIALLMVGLCPYESWRIRPGNILQPSVVFMVATLGLLAFVLLFGVARKGAQRWLSVGPPELGLGFQPSEVAKVALVVFLAAFCGYLGNRVRRFWTGFLPAALVIGACVGLVGKEDLGTAALLAAVGGGMLLVARARWWHMALCCLPGLLGLSYFLFDAEKAYRLKRLTSFLNPELDPQGAGYHQIQSLVTIASGGWWGCGLGNGVQKYGYLPEGRTDFIFSVICEELGIVGGIGVIGLFVVLLWQGKRTMDRTVDPFGRLLALGATLTIGLQAAINVAVVTVSIPTKGIALPLVSAGGTGVVIFAVLIGMLANVARTRSASPAGQSSPAPPARAALKTTRVAPERGLPPVGLATHAGSAGY